MVRSPSPYDSHEDDDDISYVHNKAEIKEFNDSDADVTVEVNVDLDVESEDVKK